MRATSTASEPLTVTGVTKRFFQGKTAIEALRNVSLRVSEGEFVAVMGPSGSGKSTLLHVMAGLTRTDSGSVSVEGQSLSDLSDARLTDFRRRRIGLVFQQFNLIPALTALENVMLPLLIEGTDRTGKLRDKAGSLLERLGLSQRSEHRPDAMSGGEQQRVAIARSLMADPAIVLADEPTGSLDSTNSKAICSLFRELNEREGRTIVVVTHEPSVAAWAKRIVVMKDGAVRSEFTSNGGTDAHELAVRYQDIVSESTVAEAT